MNLFSKKALKKAIIKGGKGLRGMELDGMGAVPLAVVAAEAVLVEQAGLRHDLLDLEHLRSYLHSCT